MSFLARKTKASPVRPPERPLAPARPVAEPTAPLESPHPVPAGTGLALGAVVFAFVTLPTATPTEMARYAAITVGLGLAGSVFMDLKKGVWNLPRADLFSLLAFYFLTLFEFLFPQPKFNTMTTQANLPSDGILRRARRVRRAARRAPYCSGQKSSRSHEVMTHEIPPGWLVALFWLAAGIGYLHMLMAVNFNVLTMINWFSEPRFTQPWSRGKFGDWKAMLFELGMLIQLLPPLAGIMIARRKRFPILASPADARRASAITFYSGFASGTRNVLASYLVTFLIGYAFALPTDAAERNSSFFPSAADVVMTFATFFMLQFRNVGLKNYLARKRGARDLDGSRRRSEGPHTLYVDYNLFSICRLAEVFPERYREYLGFEIPYLALIRPIPRALVERQARGHEHVHRGCDGHGRVSPSPRAFAGEAYMSGGNIAVFLIGLAFGAATGWWCFLASPRNSEIGILIYASGFFAAVISMRSLLVFTTALLPTIAGIAIATWLVGMLRKSIGKQRK